MIVNAICQICGEIYAKIDTDRVTYPLAGSMFASPDEAHGVPAPFAAFETWDDMRCSFGRIHRPFVQDNEILTDKGLLVIPKDGQPPYLTDPKGEIDRDSICDRSQCVSEEEAAKQVRAELAKSNPDPFKGFADNAMEYGVKYVETLMETTEHGKTRGKRKGQHGIRKART